MRAYHLMLTCAALFAAGCARPVVDTHPIPSVGGTIAGIATTADPTVVVPGRKVTAVEVSRGSRYDATTGANGGYTIKVPEGTYRLEIELRGGETLAKRPDDTRINNGDLDPGRDFVITVRSGRQ